MELFAVIGKPILHSKSPQMHNAGFEKLKINSLYFRIASASAKNALETAKEIGVSGLNVTSPYKEDAATFADSLDKPSKILGASNCLVLKGDKISGMNTDVCGVSDVFAAQKIPLVGKKVLVIGSGGAARAAALAMIESGAQVTIANRDEQKARSVAGLLGCSSCSLSKEALGPQAHVSEIIISAVPYSGQIIPAQFLNKNTIVLDANYAQESALVADAKAKGCQVIDGQEWLLHQGAAAFKIFTKKDAPLDAMRKSLVQASHEAKESIAISGFMGTGKTTVAKMLSSRTGIPLIDTDSEIEEATTMRVPDFFASKGEAAFRKQESLVVERVFARGGEKVVSLGGGSLLDEKNLEAARENARIFCLWASPEKISQRLGNTSGRPLLAGKNPDKKISAILEQRKLSYLAGADCVIGTSSLTPEEICGVIFDEIR